MGKYIEWYCEPSGKSMRIFKPKGNLFLINYPKHNVYLKVKCIDKISSKVYCYV